MPRRCYNAWLPDGTRAIVCGNLGAPCSSCGGVASFQCDGPVGRRRTCDTHLCGVHAIVVGPNRHYCPSCYAAAYTSKAPIQPELIA